MKKIVWLGGAVLLSAFAAAQDISYATGSWNGDALGNHRAVIRVEVQADAVLVRIPWRRRDPNPETKAVFFVDSRTGNRVKNVAPLAVSRESGDFVFQPVSGPGDYFAYDMPYRLAGSRNYPNAVYLPAERTAEPDWLARHGLTSGTDARTITFPAARVVEFQSVDAFNSYAPMELIATAEETRNLIAQFPDAPYLVFPEDRKFSIRMTADLPWRWVESGPRREFRGEAARGEYFSFQLGVYACRTDIADVAVAFGDLQSASGRVIPAAAFRCINTGGTDWNGEPLTKTVSVAKGKVQALWCGVQVPADAAAETSTAVVRIRPRGLPESTVLFTL